MIKVKKSSKMIAGMVISLALIGSAMPMTASVSASEVSILQGDANNDNIVNVRDVAWLSRYLQGTAHATAYNITCADATRDGIIDYQDHNMILDFCVNQTSVVPITYRTELYDNLNNEEREYYKFSYANGSSIGIEEYTLQSPSASTTAYNLLRETTDTPEFIRDTSNIGVVKIECDFGTFTSLGSGFIVDDHLIVTAAHSVCGGTAAEPTANPNITVKVYNANETTSKVYTIDSIHVPQEFYAYDEERDYNYDYALLHIDSHYDNIPIRTFSQYEPFKLGYMTSKFIDDKGSIVTSGFTDAPDSEEGNHRYYSMGNIDVNVLVQTTDLRYYSNSGANGGDSGGLAYYNSVYNNELIKSAIGNITGGGSNVNYIACGVRITPTIARFIFNNENI